MSKHRGSPARNQRAYRVLMSWLRLRPERADQWLAVLQDKDSRPRVRDWLMMAWLALRMIWRRPDAEKVVSDYRKCVRCPIHDRRMRRCGADPGVGCHCYQPLAVLFGKRCWIREVEPDSPF